MVGGFYRRSIAAASDAIVAPEASAFVLHLVRVVFLLLTYLEYKSLKGLILW
jgi:hypothetical protein